jgi:hypothetical protein
MNRNATWKTGGNLYFWKILTAYNTIIREWKKDPLVCQEAYTRGKNSVRRTAIQPHAPQSDSLAPVSDWTARPRVSVSPPCPRSANKNNALLTISDTHISGVGVCKIDILSKCPSFCSVTYWFFFFKLTCFHFRGQTQFNSVSLSSGADNHLPTRQMRVEFRIGV